MTADPGTQLKLPLPVSTLGLLNRRGLVPRTLSDGALIGRLLAGLAARDPGLEGLLLADDGDFAHAGHPALGYLRRRLPDGLGPDRIVSVAALLAPVPGAEETMGTNGVAGQLVVEELAGLGWGGDPVAFFRDWLDLLFAVQVRLFARYGIALESHQQNAAVVVGPSTLRLLVKDFDGALIHHARLTGALGADGPSRPRSATGGCSPGTTTSSRTCSSRSPCTCARERWPSAWPTGATPRCPGCWPWSGRRWRARSTGRPAQPATGRLRARVLEAERLTGKAMVTAGTLTQKTRTGARDINKFYGPGGP